MLTIQNKIITIFIISCILLISSTANANDAWPSNFSWSYPQTLTPETSSFQYTWRFHLSSDHYRSCQYTVDLYLSRDRTFSSSNDHLLISDPYNEVPAGAIGFTSTVTWYSGWTLPSTGGTYYVFLKLSPGIGAPTDTNTSNNVVMAANPIQVIVDEEPPPPPPCTFTPVPGRKAHVYDPVNQILYTTTESGVVERYDVITRGFLSPWTIGGNPGGIDVTPDGGTVLVADQDTINDVGYIHCVDASSGIVTTHEFPLCEGQQFDGSVLSFDSLSGKIYVSYRDGIGIHPINIGPFGDTEDFETNDFSKFPWERSGDANWTTTSQESSSGLYSAKAGSISNNEVTTLQVTLECIAGDITFCRKVSSESNYDYLEFYIDGHLEEKWSGEQDWEEVSFPVTAGTRTFEWTYSKDGSMSRGDDTAWIDYITFPIAGGAQIAANGEMHPNQFNSVELSEEPLTNVEKVTEQVIFSR